MKTNLTFMRLSAALLVILLQSSTLNSQTLLIENFNYSSGTSLTSNGWSAHSGAGNNPVSVGSPGLVYQGYPSSNIGLAAILDNTGEDVNKTFPQVTGGTVFCAFLVRVDTIYDGYFLHFGRSSIGTSQIGRIFISGTGNNFNFGLSLGSNTPTLTTGEIYSTTSVYLVVLKYSFIPGLLNDEVSLFVFSGTIPGTEPSTPTIGPLLDASVDDINNIGSVALRQYSAKQDIIVDGIRIAQNWEDALGFTTGNEAHLRKTEPVIYPVPAGNYLNVSNIDNITRIEIMDIAGRSLITLMNETSDNVIIPVSNLSSGFYIVRLMSLDGIKIMKFIKQ